MPNNFVSDNSILDCPILRKNCGDFVAGVNYNVGAECRGDQLIITHKLTGRSFISRLINDGVAKFSVQLYYQNSGEREHHYFSGEVNKNGDECIAKQIIKNHFSYPPEITANIVIVADKEITINPDSGLSDFWGVGETFRVPQSTRIAYHQKLSFGRGEVDHLIKIECKDEYKNGQMEVVVSENADHTEKPVTVICAQDVFDQLKKIKPSSYEKPGTINDTVRLAILTQILCAVYAYVRQIAANENGEITNSNLLKHLLALKSKHPHRLDWEDAENFNPSFAATTMCPYFLNSLKEDNGE